MTGEVSEGLVSEGEVWWENILHALRLGCIDVDEAGGTMVPCISSSVMASCVPSAGEAITSYIRKLLHLARNDKP